MTRTYNSLTLEDAKHMLTAAEAKAVSLGIAYNIAVVDAGGHLFSVRSPGRSADWQHRPGDRQGCDCENLR